MTTIIERARATDHCPACGYVAEKRKGKPRSVPQHRRYFAMVRHAFQHWPERHDFRPSSDEHLRKYLQCKAGYHTVQTIDTAKMTNAQAVAAIAAAMREPFGFVKAVDTKLHVFHSQSIDFDNLPHLKACALFDAVAEVIAAEMGAKIEAVLPPVSEVKPRAREQLREASL